MKRVGGSYSITTFSVWQTVPTTNVLSLDVNGDVILIPGGGGDLLTLETRIETLETKLNELTALLAQAK